MDEFVGRWLLPLQQMGFLSLSVHPSGEILFCWNMPVGDEEEIAPPYPGIHIQADLDVVVPPGAPVSVLWMLERGAEPVSRGEAAVYRITKESIRRLLSGGDSIDDWLAALHKHAYSAVPSTVEAAVRQWAYAVGAVAFSQATIMTCKDAHMAELIGGHPDCQPFLVEKWGDSAHVVLSDRLKDLILVLKRLDLYPAQPSAAHPAPDASEECGSNPAGILTTKFPDPVYQVIPPSTAVREPDGKDVPPSWLKELRSYHISTRKEMIRKALEWSTVLRLKSGDHEWEVVPRELKETPEGWVMIGSRDASPVILKTEEWEEMQILLPGINDG